MQVRYFFIEITKPGEYFGGGLHFIKKKQGLAGADKFADGSMLQYIGDYNFLYASGWLLVISVIVIVVVSLLSEPPSLAQIENLTYSTATDAQRKENRESWNKWDVIATAVVLGLVLGMYLYFSFWLN